MPVRPQPAGVNSPVVTVALMAATWSVTAADWDNFSDTWVATDALGRRVSTAAQTGPPRTDRTVGLFYFLWHGAHVQGGPYDVTKILAQNPQAMSQPDSPLWGPLHAPHHWGESIFGYYRTADAGVLRKHAQMLGDAGVDVVIFDVTNQVTYRDDYFALLREWSAWRQLGNRTPQVAFLTPFWDPPKVVRELWRDLYATGQFRDLWFQWEGKPLILADPALLLSHEENAAQDHPAEVRPGHTLGQTFRSDRTLHAVSGRFPTWGTTNAAVTLTWRRDHAAGPVVASRRFDRVADNAWLRLVPAAPVPPGTYHLEASEPAGRIGWWSHAQESFAAGDATADGAKAAGDRTLRLLWADAETAAIRDFFTFRKPQPDYFQGPTQPDMWSWLEVAPQHVFHNARGEKEQMSVGVAQNAVQGRLGSMSEPGALGRSFHDGKSAAGAGSVRWGLNFSEQWANALREDPRFVFVTGWNEWIMGRFNEFNRIKLPVMFVDQFDQEHSRDLEPMRGGHGDDYYCQFVDYIRRYKGVRAVPPLRSVAVQMDGSFADWAGVEPEFRDTVGDPVRRHHRGWDAQVTYTNATGRNDLVAAKTSWTRREAAFYVRTREPLTPASEDAWMLLFLDTDADTRTGWLGYDFVVNRTRTDHHAVSVERNVGGRYEWTAVGTAELCVGERELELSLPWKRLGLRRAPAALDFKWADHIGQTGDWSDFTLNGDAAPNDRFNFRAVPAAP